MSASLTSSLQPEPDVGEVRTRPNVLPPKKRKRDKMGKPLIHRKTGKVVGWVLPDGDSTEWTDASASSTEVEGEEQPADIDLTNSGDKGGQSGTGVPRLHSHGLVRFTQVPIGPSDRQTLLAPVTLSSYVQAHGVVATGSQWGAGQRSGVGTVATETHT